MSTCFNRALQKVAIRPGGERIFQGSQYGAGSSGAMPPLPTYPPGPPASGGAAPTTSTTKGFDSLIGREEEGEARLDAHQADYNQLGSYVNLDDVIHVGPGSGVLEKEDTEPELSEGAQEDHHGPN